MDVPSELARLPQWVCWKRVKRKGKLTKQPFRAVDGRPASVTDSADWVDFETALRGMVEHDLEGVGFVFTEDDPYAGVDFDHCIDEAGNVHPSVLRFVDGLDTYWEISPSGTGLHCIFRGSLGQGRRSEGDWGGNIEAYDNGRYFTFTGRVFEGHDTIQDVILPDDVLLYGDDRRIINNCRRNAKNFVALFDEGDISEYDNDQSTADIALANALAARTQDPQQIERIMRQSQLARDKWDHPDTGSIWLRRRCIEPAIRDTKKKALSGDFEADVAAEMYRLEVRDEARSRYQSISSDEASLLLPPAGWTVTDDLKLNEPPPPFIIDRLQLIGHNALLVAKYKLGKTTLTLNLARSLVTGEPFLGHFDVHLEEGNVAVWNYELIREQWNDWIRQMDFATDRLIAAHFRGKDIIPLWNKETQKYVADWLQGNDVKYWIIDPTMKAWTGLLQSEGDNIGAARFLDAIDAIKDLAGVPCTLLSHHTGRNEEAQERARGATRLDDWRDVGWVMSGVRDHIDFQADGRGVELDKIRITYNEEERRSFSTEARPAEEAEKSTGARGAVRALAELEDAGVPLEERKTSAVTSKMTGTQEARREGFQQAVNNGWIKREEGPRKALLCTLTKMGRRELEKDE